nr:hypothetical protein [Candidatus Planktophila limnetica]
MDLIYGLLVVLGAILWANAEHCMSKGEMSGQLLTRFALFRAILHVFPVASPLLAPFKGQVATLADLGGKPVFSFSNHELKGNAVLAKLLCVIYFCVAIKK